MDKEPNKIKFFRRKKGLSQEALGKAIGGKKKDTISKWERGERKLKIEEAKKLSIVLGISIGELAGEIEENLYSVDETLMQLAAEAIQNTAHEQSKQLTLTQAMAYTVMLYNHIIEFRKKGKAVLPNEENATLVLKNIAV